VSTEKTLRDAMGVLIHRGRAFADYGDLDSGPVCVLAAIAIAAGLGPDAWRYLDEAPEQEWEPSETRMVEAARALLAVTAPWVDAYDTAISDLISLVADWYDRATDNDLYGALLLAGLSLPVENGAHA
jgi:hypothetical protein